MTASAAAELGQHTVSEIADRVGKLYTLPAVANQVIELTSDPHVDCAQLKTCIERDPALTVRILRVVNSPLFGLSGQVDDLNQALAMLGVKPLKMLVLGFTLPQALFLNVAREQLDWYWRSTLARAAAARTLAEKLFHDAGDEAFLAGLLQDIGVLALMGQLGQPYAEVVGHVIAERMNLQDVEREALGFDHTELTARLMENWNMPKSLALAIGEPKIHQRLARSREDHATLAKTLHLAELLAQLVAQCRLSVLPELLEAGQAYAEFDKETLDSLVRALDPKVRELAAALALPRQPERDYLEILTTAHQRLADMTDEYITPSGDAGESEDSVSNLSSTAQGNLRSAVQRYLAAPSDAAPAIVELARVSPEHLESRFADASIDYARIHQSLTYGETVTRQVSQAVDQARTDRTSVSVALLAIRGVGPLEPDQLRIAGQLLRAVCRRTMDIDATCTEIADGQLMWTLVGKDRSEAVALANAALQQVRAAAPQLREAGKLAECVSAAGIASVETPTKNFPPSRLLDAATRCLSAAFSGGGTVKSLVVS